MTDHLPYLQAVERTLNASGFIAEPAKALTEPCRWGGMLLTVQDDWGEYGAELAALRWSEIEQRRRGFIVPDGWSLKWLGLTRELQVPILASPAEVCNALALEVGSQAHAAPVGPPSAASRAGTADFEAVLETYVYLGATS